MTTNAELFYRDPTKTEIPNLGVAKVMEPQTPEEWAVLRWELESFVCQGEYQAGLERILSSYLSSLDQQQQPAVWISGFYGSGKSHLVRVLEYLWRDVSFPDGKTARDLVTLPDDIRALLRELETVGRRSGGLWSAAGTLGAGTRDSIRISLLAVLLKAAKLPTSYPAARLAIWLKQNGYYEAVREAVEAQGKAWTEELNYHMYVSPPLHKALSQVVTEWGVDSKEVRQTLRAQYPSVQDISDEDMLHTMEDVLELQSSTPGQLPHTLLIFDELQQFIGQDSDRTLLVQNLVEACSSRFGSRLLVVATGQSALQATTELSKLQGRFTVKVGLSDTDVHRVVREVVLLKTPTHTSQLSAVLERVSGEIDRQLGGTRIAANPADKADLVPDYPILPTRRRFWERVLRALDHQGIIAQLRTQLRMIHEANKQVADKPLGWVVAGDFIYDQLVTDMLQAGVLPREIQQLIEEQDDGSEDGRLRRRLCATIFMISQLRAGEPTETGVRATPEILCDLLVEDLNAGSASLRQRVPEMLNALAEQGILMEVDGEYHLQTRESAEWQADFRKAYNRLYNDTTRIASDRNQEFRQAIIKVTKEITLVQGQSKVPRKLDLHFGEEAPSAKTENIPVWIRDEWSVSPRALQQEAQAAGVDSPIVYVLIPKNDDGSLHEVLAAHAAAEETLGSRPIPKTTEGLQARAAMETRKKTLRGTLDTRIANLLSKARVFQGGGNEVFGNSLAQAIQTAAEASMARMFPRFNLGDNPSWAKVVARALVGAPDALVAVGHNGNVEHHPVCRDIRAWLNSEGKEGRKVHEYFCGIESGCGWPRDAVDGALLALAAAGLVRITRNGETISPKGLPQSQIGTCKFHSEARVISTIQRIQMRGWLAALGVKHEDGNELQAVPEALRKLREAAQAAGGEPPLPAQPSTHAISVLQGLHGNEQFVTVYEQREDLLADYKAWQEQKQRIDARLPRWKLLQRLLQHAGDTPEVQDVRQQAKAIFEQRSLLESPDPLTPLLNTTSAAVRAELQACINEFVQTRNEVMAELESDPVWQQLTATEQETLIDNHGLKPVEMPQIGTDERLVQALDACSLAGWSDRTAALSTRAAAARAEAVRLREPKAIKVKVPSATLRTAEEVDTYLKDLRKRIMAEIDEGHPVIL